MAQTGNLTSGAAAVAVRRAMHDHWGVFLGEGVVLVVLGLAAIILPSIAGLAVTVILGWLFLVAGIVGLLATASARRAPGLGWSVLSAIAALLAGLVLLWDPLAGLLTLTYVLTAFFLVDGVVIIALAIAHRNEASGRWQWMMSNGVIDVILAGMIILGPAGSRRLGGGIAGRARPGVRRQLADRHGAGGAQGEPVTGSGLRQQQLGQLLRPVEHDVVAAIDLVHHPGRIRAQALGKRLERHAVIAGSRPRRPAGRSPVPAR